MTEAAMVVVERPKGVMYSVVLEYINGILFLFFGYLALLEGFIPFLNFILGFLMIIVGYGLWKLKKWGYQVTKILAIYVIITSILNFLMYFYFDFISLIIQIIIIYILTRPEIKEVFGIIGFLS